MKLTNRDRLTEYRRKLANLYARRLAARARGRLTAKEIREAAKLYGPAGWAPYAPDFIGHRTRGSFARDFAELREFDAAIQPRERARFATFCRDKFFRYGPSVWPEDRAEIG